MTTALQQALDVLRGCLDHPDAADAIAALQAAIAQPEQQALQPLTDEQIDRATDGQLGAFVGAGTYERYRWYARAIEAAHNIKEKD